MQAGYAVLVCLYVHRRMCLWQTSFLCGTAVCLRRRCGRCVQNVLWPCRASDPPTSSTPCVSHQTLWPSTPMGMFASWSSSVVSLQHRHNIVYMFVVHFIYLFFCFYHSYTHSFCLWLSACHLVCCVLCIVYCHTDTGTKFGGGFFIIIEINSLIVRLSLSNSRLNSVNQRIHCFLFTGLLPSCVSVSVCRSSVSLDVSGFAKVYRSHLHRQHLSPSQCIKLEISYQELLILLLFFCDCFFSVWYSPFFFFIPFLSHSLLYTNMHAFTHS